MRKNLTRKYTICLKSRGMAITVMPSVLAKLVLCETLKSKAELVMKIVHFANLIKSIKYEFALHRKTEREKEKSLL